MKLKDVNMDSVEQAVAYYQECQRDGTWTPSKAEALLSHHKRPREVMVAIGGQPKTTAAT